MRLLRHGWVLLIALLLPVIAPRLPIAASLTSAAPTTAVLNAVIEGTPPQGGVVERTGAHRDGSRRGHGRVAGDHL